ncbi:MAG: DUF3892 domain-containing protein [Candidatus Margulisiibacteriota bacterium]
MKTYDAFFEALGQKESSGNYSVVQKKYGYLGKYQMGEAALIDSGYYKRDGKINNSFLDNFWTGKDGVHSKQDFLENHQAQENAIREYMKVQWRYIISVNLDRFVDQTRDGILFTVSGLLAGAHLGGHGRLKAYLKDNQLFPDGNGVVVTEYIQKFGGYETPFKPRKQLTGIRKDENKKTIAYQIDGRDWVSVGTAIEMVKALELDGVVVTSVKGTVFLRTPPDQVRENNLVG